MFFHIFAVYDLQIRLCLYSVLTNCFIFEFVTIWINISIRLIAVCQASLQTNCSHIREPGEKWQRAVSPNGKGPALVSESQWKDYRQSTLSVTAHQLSMWPKSFRPLVSLCRLICSGTLCPFLRLITAPLVLQSICILPPCPCWPPQRRVPATFSRNASLSDSIPPWCMCVSVF